MPLDAGDQANRLALSRDLQQQALIDVPSVPTGQMLQATAYRNNLIGVLKGFVLFGMFARPEATRIQARSSGIALAAIRIATGNLPPATAVAGPAGGLKRAPRWAV
jgi:hypothetical protein